MFSLLKGLLYGMAIGILIAPDKGVETRKKIIQLFTDLKEDAENVIHNSAENIEEKTEPMG